MAGAGAGRAISGGAPASGAEPTELGLTAAGDGLGRRGSGAGHLGVGVVSGPLEGPDLRWTAVESDAWPRLAAGAQPAGADLGAADEGALLEPLASATGLILGAGGWLASGFRLALGESPQSALADLAERPPSYLFGSAAAYTRLWGRADERLGPPGGWRRRLVAWAIFRGPEAGGGKRGAWGRRWAWLLVGRPLARVLGLAEVRRAVVVGRLRGDVAVALAGLRIVPVSAQFAGLEGDAGQLPGAPDTPSNVLDRAGTTSGLSRPVVEVETAVGRLAAAAGPDASLRANGAVAR